MSTMTHEQLMNEPVDVMAWQDSAAHRLAQNYQHTERVVENALKPYSYDVYTFRNVALTFRREDYIAWDKACAARGLR